MSDRTQPSKRQKGGGAKSNRDQAENGEGERVHALKVAMACAAEGHSEGPEAHNLTGFQASSLCLILICLSDGPESLPVLFCELPSQMEQVVPPDSVFLSGRGAWLKPGRRGDGDEGRVDLVETFLVQSNLAPFNARGH